MKQLSSVFRRARIWRIAGCAGMMLGSVAGAAAAGATVSVKVAFVNHGGSSKPTARQSVIAWLTPLPESPNQVRKFRSEQHHGRFQLVQKNKRFEPPVIVVPVGSPVEFPNRDPFFHNVFSLFDGKRFDLGLYEAGSTRRLVFDRPGICYIFCNIHPEMSAVVIVVSTAYFGAASPDGELVIAEVPPGQYRLHIWHERSLPEELAKLTREITVAENNLSLGTIRLTEAVGLLPTHKNKYGRDYDPIAPSTPIYDQK